MSYPSLPKDPSLIPISSIYIPGTGWVALQGVTPTTDGSGNQSAPVSAALYGKVTNPGDTPVLLDSSGRVLISLAQVAGNTIAIAATGIMKVGVTDGTGTAITSTSAALDVNIKSGAGSGFSVVDEAGWTAGTSPFEPAGGVFNDSATVLTSGQQGTARLTNNRALHANLRDASGNQLLGSKTSANSVPVVVASDQGVISTAIQATSGTALLADQSNTELRTSLYGKSTTAGDTPVATDASGNVGVNVIGALPAGAALIGKVNIQAAGNSLAADNTNVLRTSLYGKVTAAGDTPVLLDASGRPIVNINTMPAITGTVTANIGTTNGLALDASVTALQVSQGSTTSGQKGDLVQGAVTTSAPSYTTAQTSPLSLTPAGALRTDGSATTQPVSGTVTSVVQAVAGTALGADQTNSELRVSLYGKSTTAGDTPLLLDSSGRPMVNIAQIGGQAAAMAGSDGQTAANVPLEAMGVYNGSTVDRLAGLSGFAATEASISNWIRSGKAYSCSTGKITAAANQAASFFIPNTNAKNILIWSVRIIYSNASQLTEFRSLTADDTNITAGTSDAGNVIALKAGGTASASGFAMHHASAVTAPAVSASTLPLDEILNAVNVNAELLSPGMVLFIPPSTASGIAIYTGTTAAGSWAATVRWIEY